MPRYQFNDEIQRYMRILIVILLLGLTWFSQHGWAQTSPYPSKPIRMIIPFAAGGPTDVIARALIDKLSGPFGQPLILDNKGGAGAVLGIDMVAKAPADGYTWLVTTGSMTSISAFNENVPFDPIKDFVPVTMVARNFGQILVVHPSMKANTVGELISLAKANPGKLNYASAGIGNITYIAAEQMKAATGVQINDIQYKGTAPAISDLLGNHVDLCFAPGSIVLPLIQAGKLKALAITGPNRWKALPNLPTMQEAGLKNIELTGWFGVYLPAKTSPEIVNRIYTEIQKAFTDPDIVKRLDDTGFEVIVSRPDIFAKFSEDDVQSMKDLARKIGLNKK